MAGHSEARVRAARRRIVRGQHGKSDLIDGRILQSKDTDGISHRHFSLRENVVPSIRFPVAGLFRQSVQVVKRPIHMGFQIEDLAPTPDGPGSRICPPAPLFQEGLRILVGLARFTILSNHETRGCERPAARGEDADGACSRTGATEDRPHDRAANLPLPLSRPAPATAAPATQQGQGGKEGGEEGEGLDGEGEETPARTAAA
eukprot:CAMPEP_0114495886 /NCGR_PEP_ID=MMETSP0109-20121206/5469_1 /TAXON_ID=29199 /ORGANISM="Chlorarachnion reptans, Strain CCCM449" /LENGTH=202 /DNA_ID=CAMNT_0001673109 /DNA_START=909 /DNA_END=1514 /DNA_ORIENTATION=+